MKTRAIAIFMIIMAACGGSVTQRTSQALGTALGATNAARDQFSAWDKQHQLDIVDRATTREQAEAELAAYRAKRQKIVQAFTVAYGAIASAAATVPLVEAGVKKETDLLGLLTDAVGAVQTVMGSVKDIRDAFGEKPAVAPPNPEPAAPAEGSGPSEPAPSAPQPTAEAA
jgi:hypothetical protein